MNILQLLEKMTLEEKIGQLMQLPPHNFVVTSTKDVAGHIYDLGLTKEEVFLSGSILGIRNAEEMIKVQTLYLEHSRLQIPLLFMADIIHGYETIFPIPLALACSFNTDMAKKVAEISAVEASSAGIGVTFSPMADLSRDPRWGRVMEGFGEDPLLVAAFSEAFVKGYQKESFNEESSMASCIKHFAGYGAVEAGRDYNRVDMSMSTFYNYFNSGYESAVNANARLVMPSFTTFDGVPMTINKDMLQTVLRDNMGFDGVIITDYDGLNQTISHGVVENQKVAARRGIEASLDIEMASSCYMQNLETLVKEKVIKESDIDKSVLRVLKLKEELGLFDNPYRFASTEKEAEVVFSDSHLKYSKEVALESAVLLKNDNNILPLKVKEIAVMGELALSKSTNGAWCWHGNMDRNISLLDGLSKHIDAQYYENITDISNNIDTVIYVLGEGAYDSGEAKSKASLRLNERDISRIKRLKEKGKKVISVLYTGRPYILTDIIESDAILLAWYLGSKSSDALAELLIGLENPSGKLAMTFPHHEGQIPLYYNYLSTGRPYNKHNSYTSFYTDMPNDPLFTFGYGLSYSSFQYKLEERKDRILSDNQSLTLKVQVSNTSDIDGKEIVQCYMHDTFAGISRPLKELIAFKKVFIKAHETVEVSFKITVDMLQYRNKENKRVLENGDIELFVGPHLGILQSETIKYIGGLI